MVVETFSKLNDMAVWNQTLQKIVFSSSPKKKNFENSLLTTLHSTLETCGIHNKDVDNVITGLEAVIRPRSTYSVDCI